MAKPEMRAILVAFHQKGWALYECPIDGAPPIQAGVSMPIDNLIENRVYLVLPESLRDDDENLPRLKPQYTDEIGTRYVRKFFVLGDEACFVPGGCDNEPFSRLPLDDAVMIIARNLTSYESEAARRHNGRA